MNANLLASIIGAGGALTGAAMGSRAQGSANRNAQANADRLYGLADQEQQRRNALLAAILPKINKTLGLPGGSGQPTPGIGSGSGVANYGTSLQAPSSGSGLKNIGAGAGLGFTVAGPVGAAAGAGAGELVNLIKKFGADEANSWTSKVQDPFGKMVAGVIDPYDAAKKAGTLTAEQQAEAQRQLERLISEYNQAASVYRGRGKKQNTVIDQSFQTLNPLLDAWRKNVYAPIGGAQ